MTKTVTIPSHCMVTVRRPDGTVETIRHPKITTMIPKLWAEMKKAMAAAGRGECISYENVTKTVAAIQPTQAELERDRYERERDTIYRASAGGEPVDTDHDGWDNTPHNKPDYD